MDQCVRVPLICSLDLLGVDVEKSRFMMTLIFFDSLHSSTLDMQSFSSCVDVGLCIWCHWCWSMGSSGPQFLSLFIADFNFYINIMSINLYKEGMQIQLVNMYRLFKTYVPNSIIDLTCRFNYSWDEKNCQCQQAK